MPFDKIYSYRMKLEQQKGIRDNLQKQYGAIKKDITETDNKIETVEEAQKVIQIVAKKTQSELEIGINNMVTKALSSIFGKSYSFLLKFVLRRDKTEADLVWEQEGNEYLPNGGGIRDISAFGFRIALRNLQNEEGEPILILDEPWKHLKPFSLQEKAAKLLQEISKEFGLQTIMVTSAETDNAPSLLKYSDKVYKVVKENKRSTIQNLKGEEDE